MTESSSMQLTQNMLECISRRLSGREDCRNVNYCVQVSDSGIIMNPSIDIYPDKHHRKASDKTNVVNWIVSTVLTGACISDLIPGTYIYESSIDRKKRRWYRHDNYIG